VSEIQKIDQRDDEHPNQIYEVPVKAQYFNVIGIVAAALVTYAYNDQSDYAAGDVGEVQARNAEE
jgi:hypothetical protein